MNKDKLTTDNYSEYWNKKIYETIPAVLLERDLPLWGFCKNITQARNDRKQGVGPRFLKSENGAIIYHKEYLIEWHQAQPKEKRSILHFPKKKKKKTKETPGQMEFILE